VLCSHCAHLHETLSYLMRRAPGRFSVEARHFPLDGTCNPAIQQKANPVRCAAAAAQICVEPTGHARELASALFSRQASLSTDAVLALATPFLPRKQLEACMADPATGQALRGDIEAALRYEPDGTPVVALNGRLGSAYGPFLYAMILAGGDPAHPALAGLAGGSR
jgi:protein-disulfide isomerase